MKRALIAVLVFGALVGAVYGAAAGLGSVDSADVGSGSADVLSCDDNGVTTAYTVVSGRVSQVTVGGIKDGEAGIGNGACDGRTVIVQLVNDPAGVIAIGKVLHVGDDAFLTGDDSEDVAPNDDWTGGTPVGSAVLAEDVDDIVVTISDGIVTLSGSRTGSDLAETIAP